MPVLSKDYVYQLASKWANAVSANYAAKGKQIDPEAFSRYLLAIAQKESTLNSDAENKSSTARGLMQILINTQREIEAKRAKVKFPLAMYKSKFYPKAPVTKSKSLDKIFDPDYSMMLAAYELAYQYFRYGQNWQKAVHAYNQGSVPGVNPNDGANYASAVTKYYNSDKNTQFASANKSKLINSKYGVYVYTT